MNDEVTIDLVMTAKVRKKKATWPGVEKQIKEKEGNEGEWQKMVHASSIYILPMYVLQQRLGTQVMVIYEGW